MMAKRKVNISALVLATALAVSASLLPGTGVHAEGREAYISEDNSSSTPDSFFIEGVEGQEYIIVRKGTVITEDSWKDAVRPGKEQYDFVSFEGLAPATLYEVCTRVAASDDSPAGEPVRLEICTGLYGYGFFPESDLVGSVITCETDPEDAEVSCRWYWDDVTEINEYQSKHDYTEIPGATGRLYTLTDADEGRNLAVRFFVDGHEVGDTQVPFTVHKKGIVTFDGMGGFGVAPSVEGEYDSLISRPADPVRTGFSFAGWYKEPDYGDYWYIDPETDEEYPISSEWDFAKDRIKWSETTLYARWEEDVYVPATLPVYRFFNPSTGDHFFTAFEKEKEALMSGASGNGWNFEGIAWYTSEWTPYPVYRLFDAGRTGAHFYTADKSVCEEYTGRGWIYEGIAWYSEGQAGRQVFRLEDHENSESFHFTASVSERDALVSLGRDCVNAGFTVK